MLEVPAEIKIAVEGSIQTLLNKDYILFAINVNERSITHKLGEYLAPYFPEWSVDCEYNRKNHNRKKTVDQLELIRRAVLHGGSPRAPRERQDMSVYPDVIVHRRLSPENLLVIETKKSTSKVPREFDFAKLELFTADLGNNENNLHYAFGVFVLFLAGGEVSQTGKLQADLLWFANGAQAEVNDNEPITAKYDPTKKMNPLQR